MPSLLSRLVASLVPHRTARQAVPDRFAQIKQVREDLEKTTRRPRPSSDERIPSNYHGGIAGKVWFLPYADSTTKDTAEIRAAMRRMRNDGYVKAAWEPQIQTVASEDYQVQPSESGNAESEEQANFCKTVIEDYLDGGIVSGVRAVLAPLGSDGFSIAEKVPGVATRGKLEKKVVLNKLAARDVDNTTVRLQGDRFGNVTGVQSMRSPGQEVFPITDFVYSRYMTVFDEPLGEAAFRPAYGCYDDQTEILTRSGWKLFADLVDADEVATLDPKTGRMDYEVPSERHSFPFKGKLFHQQSKFIDVRVTPNHRMWIGSHTHNKFRFVEASELMDGSISKTVKYKRNAVWVGEEQEFFTLPAVTHKSGTGKTGSTKSRTIPAQQLPMDDWLRFLGLWLSDGCSYREKAGNRQCWVVITQNAGPVLDEIQEVVGRLGFKAHLQKPGPNHTACNLRISSLQLWSYLAKLGKSYTKFIPTDLKQLSPRQLSILLDWLLKGDGRHDFGEGRTQYCSVSKRLADDVAEVVMKTGKAANLYPEKLPKGGPIWIVGINTAGIDGTVVNRNIDGRSWEDYDGLVSCVTTKNGIVYVRRNGKACWCGNSYWMRDTVRKLRIIHTEKKMAGMLMGTYADPDHQGPLETALAKAKSATWMAVPEGTRVEAVQLSTASEPDYKSFDESLRDEIVTSIAFATLQIIQGNVPDARGDSKTQKAMADLGPWLLMVLVSEAFNKQIFPDLIDWNYPYPAGGGYPKLTFGAVSNSELLELIQVLDGAVRLKFNPSRKHYAKALSIQEADPNDPDDSLNPQPPDPMGGMGGGFGGMPPDGGGYPTDPAMMGGGMQQFSENTHYEFREPVKWQRTGENWRSSGGRVLSDDAYQRHLQRVRERSGGQVQALAPTDPGVMRDHFRKTLGADIELVGVRRSSATEPAAAPQVPAGGRAKKAAKATGRAAKATARGAANAGNFVNRMASKVGIAGAMQGRKLALAAVDLGRGLETIDWLEGFGVGSGIQKKGRRAATRMKFIAEGFEHGFFSGNRRMIREVAKSLGVQYHKSAKKYGPVLGAAVEATMFGWTWGAKALAFGAAGAATAGAIGGILGGSAGLLAGSAAVFAVGKVAKYVDSYLGIGPTTAIRNKVEHIAGGISSKLGGQGKAWGPRQRNANAPGRVAQQLDWAEGLSAKKLSKIARGKGGALWYVTGDRRATGSGRGGKVSSGDAVKWLLAKHEVLAADKEGRAPKLDADQERIIRRAMEIQGQGSTQKQADEAERGRRGKMLTRIKAARQQESVANWARSHQSHSEFAEADPDELVVDLREAIDDLFATLGMPPSAMTDDELKGSLAVTIAQMNRSALDGSEEEVEEFAEVETFGTQGGPGYGGYQEGRSETGGIKAIGYGPLEGRVLYGLAARKALKAQAEESRPKETAVADKRTKDTLDAAVWEKSAKAVKEERNFAVAQREKYGAIKTFKTPDGKEGHIDAQGIRFTYPSAEQVARAEGLAKEARGRANEWGAPEPGQPGARGKAMLDRLKARQKDMVELAPAVKARDPQATAKVQEHAKAVLEDAGKAMEGAPPETAERITAAFDASNAGGKGPVHGAVRRFLSGLVGGESGTGMAGKVGKFLGFLGRMGGKALKMGVQSLARFSWYATKQLGKVAMSDTVRPFLYWAGTIAAVTAIVAAPVLALNYGLFGGATALASAPFAVGGAVAVGRKIGNKAAGSFLKNKYGNLLEGDEEE